jgi:preprotein translocase subunit YajC
MMKNKTKRHCRAGFYGRKLTGISNICLASVAFAQTPSGGAAQSQSALPSFLPLILILAVFYFILIRPQKKQMQQLQAMINSLKKGDDVVTTGGIHGKVTALKGKEIELEIAPNTRILLNKQGVARKITEQSGEDAQNVETQK